jgi:hypothetical protein
VRESRCASRRSAGGDRHAVDRIAYHFTTNRGVTVSGRGWDIGYGVREGSSVPVFYDAGDPGDQVVACSSGFEAY